MSWVVVFVVAVLVVAVTMACSSGLLRYDPMGEALHTQPDTGLPERPRARDVDEVRFDTAVRGYRMDVVDARLDALRDRLRDLDRQLGEQRPDVGSQQS